MVKVINILFVLTQLICSIANQLQNDDDIVCDKQVEQILVDQGFQVTCRLSQVIIADCRYQDFQNIQINIQRQLGGIQFINVKNLHFSSIFLEDLYVQFNQKGIQILQGESITIQNITINTVNNPNTLFNRYSREYQLIIQNVQELNILNINIQNQKIEGYVSVSYDLQFLNIQKSIQINNVSINLKNVCKLEWLIQSSKNIQIDQMSYFDLRESKYIDEISIQIQSESININNINIDIQVEEQTTLQQTLIYFTVNNLNIKKVNIINIINLRMPLFQICSISQYSQSTQVIIDSIILQKYVFNQIPTYVSSQNFSGQQSAIFELRCYEQTLFKQKIYIKKIELFTYQTYNVCFIYSQSFNQIVIDQIIVHSNPYENAISNIWNSQGIFLFDGSSFDDTELIINNVDIHQINYISSQYGIFYINKFKKIAINNTTITSSQNLQSSQGTLFTFQRSLEINIFNLKATIYPSCQFQCLYGGLINIDNSKLVNISNFQFNQQEFFTEEVIHTGIQGGIVYISQIEKSIFQNIQAYGIFSSSADGAFAYINSQTLELKNVMITHFISQKNGGAFFIDSETTLYDVKLIQNKSFFLGGALLITRLVKAYNVLIEKNESLFGGGIYFQLSISNIQNIIFKENIGLVRGNDYSLEIDQIQLMQLFEYNSQLFPPYQIINYSMQEISQNEYRTDFVKNTLTYFVTIKFRMKGEQEWIENINNQQVIQNGYNDLTSVLYCSQQLSNEAALKIQNISRNVNQFYYSFSVQKKSKSNEFYGLCSVINNEKTFSIISKINNNCSSGMIQQHIQNMPYCQYCIDSVAYNTNINNPPNKCLSCSKEYFDLCQADYSLLKEGFWRQNLTVDPSQIFACQINKFNCLGGNFTGNQLCAKGHIGVECQECDLYNFRGQGSFTRKNIYQCSECDEITYNIIKIIFLALAIFIVIIIIFKTNYRQQKNFIYKKYLSDMKILYLGKSYYRLGQSGSYIKILTFYLQIISISSQFYGTQTWVNAFSFQQSFYSPITGSVFSLDCFLSSYTKSTTSIAYQKILIITITPFIFVALSLIPSIFQLFKSKYKRFQYSASLVISYGFTNLFCVPVVDVLIAGMLCKTFNNGESYSILDFNTQCSDSDRLIFLFTFVIPFLLIYSIVIPGILFYFLYKNRNNLDKISCRFLLGFLYADYSRKYFYWEYIRLIIKFLLIVSAYGFLSSPLLLGFVSLAILILYLIFLVKKQPYITKKLNEVEVKSIVIGCQYLIAYMISFSLYQQEIAYKNSFDTYNLVSTILLFSYNLLSLLFIGYMAGQIFISLLYPNVYKFKKYRCFNFIVKCLKILRFKQYTENKRRNFIKFRNIAKSISQNNYDEFIFLNQNENINNYKVQSVFKGDTSNCQCSQQLTELIKLNQDQNV
ncbi:hypothetical protein ABPG74_007798 [Tetrahymena malaccensis]